MKKKRNSNVTRRRAFVAKQTRTLLDEQPKISTALGNRHSSTSPRVRFNEVDIDISFRQRIVLSCRPTSDSEGLKGFKSNFYFSFFFDRLTGGGGAGGGSVGLFFFFRAPLTRVPFFFFGRHQDTVIELQ